MSTTHKNMDTVQLTIWETKKKDRKKNNTINFYIDKDIEINVGDIIEAEMNESYYTITNIRSRVQGSVEKYDYIVADVKWSGKVDNIEYYFKDIF